MKLAAVPLWLLLIALVSVLGCSDSPEDSNGAGSHGGAPADASVDGGTRVPADQDAAASAGADSGPSDGEAGVDRDSGAPPGPCFRDVVLEADEDVAAIAECTELFGTLTLTGPGLAKVELPRLEHLGGGLTVMASGLGELELPALAFVGKDLSVLNNERLTRIALPQLASTLGNVWIGADTSPDGQPALTSIELPSLTWSGALGIFANRALSSLALPALESPESVDVHGNPALIELDLPALSFLRGSEIVDNDALASVRMPSLREQDAGELHFAGKALVSIDLSALRSTTGLSIASDADFSEVQLPELEYAGRLDIGPTNATSIVLPKLTRVYSTLSVSGNPLLTSLELRALARVGDEWAGPRDSDGWGIFIEDNAQLANVELPALQVVGETLSVQRDPVLSSLTLTSLQKVLGNLLLRDCALVDFSAPVLAKVGGSGIMTGGQVWLWGDLTIADNELLQSIDLPSLTSVGHGVEISNNASLPTCDAQTLSAQFSYQPDLPPTITLDGNAGTCP